MNRTDEQTGELSKGLDKQAGKFIQRGRQTGESNRDKKHIDEWKDKQTDAWEEKQASVQTERQTNGPANKSRRGEADGWKQRDTKTGRQMEHSLASRSVNVTKRETSMSATVNRERHRGRCMSTNVNRETQRQTGISRQAPRNKGTMDGQAHGCGGTHSQTGSLRKQKETEADWQIETETDVDGQTEGK